MTMPGRYDLTLYRGDSYRWQFKCWADDTQMTPTDLTGATAKAEIRARSGGSDVILLDTTITPPNTIDMVLPADAWQAWLTKGGWDLQLTWSDEIVQTILAGIVTVTPDITDSGTVAVLEARTA